MKSGRLTVMAGPLYKYVNVNVVYHLADHPTSPITFHASRHLQPQLQQHHKRNQFNLLGTIYI
jgi:hypothetical protein